MYDIISTTKKERENFIMLIATLSSLAIICGTVGALGLCEKILEKMGIFPEDYEEEYC